MIDYANYFDWWADGGWIRVTDAKIIRAEYLFIVENFIPYNSEIRHSLEHYFEIGLDRENAMPKNKSTEFVWVSIDELTAIDLRPIIVRDCIVDSTYRTVGHMILGDDNFKQ